jgi:hypothetical protein
VRYDNLNSAVKQVLFGRSRQENERWISFKSHYGFEAWYCQPGHEGSHEKGGVEGEGGRFRRNHCVPMPVVDSIEELNALLEAADGADDARRIGSRANSVGRDWAFEKTLLRALPSESFDTALTLTPRVDRYAQVMVRCNQYSVPARFIGHRLRVKLSASAVIVYDRNMVVARHQRGRQGRQSLGFGPLSGDPAPQARRSARGHRAGAGPRGQGVHRRARRVLGCRAQSLR